MRDGSVRTDLDSNIMSCNIAFQKILGYTEEELLSKKTREITPPKWHAVETDIMQNEVQKNEKGEKIGYWGIIRDITKRKEADEALRRSEEQFRDLFENANDVIWLSDLEGKYVMVNRMFEEILGYSIKELEGKQSLFAIK